MKNQKKMLKAGARTRKAYSVFFRVAISYLWLYLCAKIRGRAYWAARIKDKHRKNAERVRDVMLDLQGLFIKFGQLISIMSNVLPDEFRKPLEQLQDDAAAHPFDLISANIEKELGKPVQELFTSIDPLPIAAASIGQVHRARIGDKEVVVKVQHPMIDELVRIDLSIIKRIISLVARFMKIKGIEHLYQQVEQMIEEELDYLQESESMQLIKNNLKDDKNIYIPIAYPAYSSKKVLTIEYCEGTKISNLEQLKEWNIKPKELTEKLVKAYCQMILVDGFYHADPHPGNLLVNKQGQIVLLDFGAVAKLSASMKEGIPLAVEAIIQQDAEELVKVLRRLGFIANGDEATKTAEALVESIQNFIRNELQLETMNMKDISPEQFRKGLKLINIRELTKIMQIPKEWVLLNRAISLVGGVAFLLTPDWNPIETLRPYMKKQLLGKEGGWTQILMDTVKKQLAIIITIPSELQKALQKINKDKLTIEIKSLDKGLKNIRSIGQQFVWLAFLIAMIFLYLHLGDGVDYPKLYTFVQAMMGVSFVGFFWAFWRSPN